MVGEADARRYRVGFDVGGTFTDFTLLGEHDGSLRFHKVASTPADPSEAIGNGLDDLIRTFQITPREIRTVGHGTTVATNMIIERSGPTTALVTTKGFRDVLEIGRQTRPNLYDYNVLKPEPLSSREWRLEIAERVMADGTILLPLNEREVEMAAEKIRKHDIKAVAVCFLHAYRFPDHERRARDILRSIVKEHCYISISSDVLPEFREYERMSTTTINAYVGPRMAAYMRRLVGATRKLGIEPELGTVHSNGGLMSVESVCSAPVKTCVSGPAAGVIGAAEIGQAAGFPNLITFDVGGTSTDVSLVSNAVPLIASSRLVADLPIKSQMVDVHVIGAGGGSIACVDAAGALMVGPESAGAVPGPMAYDRGGDRVTVTDAHICLGRLNPVALLDGRMPVDADKARRGIGEQIAAPLGLSVEEAAYGILRIANSNMARAIRYVSTERGFDIRNFALCGFGGAGGLHAAELARGCGMPLVIIPQEPGTMCARGILLSNLSMDFVRAIMETTDAKTWTEIGNVFSALLKDANRWLRTEGIAQADRRFCLRIEARYVGQNYEIPVELSGPSHGSFAEFADRFKGAHRREYGYDAGNRSIEIVNCHVKAIGLVARAEIAPVAGSGEAETAFKGHRRVYFGQTGWIEASVYERSRLPSGAEIKGAAIVEEMSATTVVLPDQSAITDRFGNLIITS